MICNKCNESKPESHFLRTTCGRYWQHTCRGCRNLQRRKYRAENADKYHAVHRVYQKKWRGENQDRAKEIQRRNYQKNETILRARRVANYWKDPVAARAAVKKAYQANPEKARAMSSAWYYRNAARSLKNHQLWNARNPDRLRLLKAYSNARRKARKFENGIEKFSFAEILKRDGYKCHICGGKVAQKDVSMDHLIPISKGGPHTRKNVAVAHLKCNVKRGAGRIPAQLLLVG